MLAAPLETRPGQRAGSTALSFATSVPNGIPGSGMCGNQTTGRQIYPGAYIKQEKPGAAPPRQEPGGALPSSPPGEQARSTMISPYCLLLLPLGACFPLLGTEEAAAGGVRGEMGWAHLPGGHRVSLPRGSPRRPRAPHPLGPLVTAKELQTSGRQRAGFRVRFGRRDDGSEATGFLLADGDKASGPLGTLAEELSGYSRKKGGFSFRFGRR
ncbi:orexigenic neuropeptide QRFP [Prionailurus iriomotensis]